MGILRPGASVHRIVEATEDNYIGYLRGMAGLDEVTWFETSELTGFKSGLSESWLNRIVRFSAPDRDVRSAVDSALDIFRRRGLPLQWSFGPPAHRIGLDRMLEARGGRSMGANIGMPGRPEHRPGSRAPV